MKALSVGPLTVQFGLVILFLGSLARPLTAQDGRLPPVELPESGSAEPLPVTEPIAADQVPLAPPMENDFSDTSSIFPMMPSWIIPNRWLASPIWEHGFELGINGSEGNAQSVSLMAAGRFKRETDRSILKTEIVYGKSEANSVVTQHYGFLDSRWDWKLGESRWTYFNMFRLEFDEFKAFDYRVNMSAGVGYSFIRNDTADLAGRFGAGASREIGGIGESWVPEADFGMDYEHQLSKKQKLTATVDYFPAWENFTDYRIVSNFAWELLLDEETNLSLKIGAIDRYDSTPLGLEPNDIDYFVTLLWKL